MADETKDNPPVKEKEKSETLPPLEGEGNAEEKVDDEPPTRQPKERPAENKEASRMGYELRQRDKQIKDLAEQVAVLQSRFGESQDDDDTGQGDKKLLEKIDRFENELQTLKGERELETQIQGVIEANPEYKKYEGTIRKYAKNEAYKNVSIDFIAAGIAHKYREADNQASEKAAGGNARRKSPAKVNVWDMSKEEFAAYQADVMKKRD